METKNLLNKKITQWVLLGAMLLGCSANAWATDYYYRGDDNSWGATKMTASSDGYYCYKQSSNSTNKFKIATSTSTWEYNCSKVSKNFNRTDVGNIGDYGGDNCYCWQTGTYYIILYYPNTNVNSSSDPKICAATKLPDDFNVSVKSDMTVGSKGTVYVGSKISKGSSDGWWYNFQVGLTTWNSSNVFIGTTQASADAITATQYGTSGDNRLLHGDLDGYTFKSAGTYYAWGGVKENANAKYACTTGTSWTTSTTPTLNSTSQIYWTVNAVPKPSACVATVTNAVSGTGTQADPYIVRPSASYTVKLTATTADASLTGYGWNINSTSSKASSSTTNTYTKAYTAGAAGSSAEYTGYAWHYNGSTTYYSSDYATSNKIYVSVQAACTAPTVTTTAAASISTTTATLGGSYTGGSATPTEVGIEWTDGKSGSIAASSVTTPFTVRATGLTAGTTYKYKAYAKACGGSKFYGTEQTFTTLPNLYLRGPIHNGCWPNDWHQLTPGANNTYSITFHPNCNYCQYGPKEFLISTSESDDNRLETSYFSGRMTGCQASSRGSEGTYNFESTLSYLNTDELTITVTWNSTNNYSIAVTRNIQAPTNLYIKGPLLTYNWYDYTQSGLTYTHIGNTYTFKFNAINTGEYGADRQFCISTSTSDEGKINLTTTGSGNGWSYLSDAMGNNFVASSDIVSANNTPITITLTYNTETGLFDMALAKDCSTPPTAGTITPDPASVCSGSTSVLTLSGSTGTSFQWYKGSDLISGATGASYTTEALTTATSYKVLVKDNNNCSAETEPVTVTITTPALAPSASANNVDYSTETLDVAFGPESNTKDIYLKANSTCVSNVTWSCDKNDGWEFNGSSASSQDPVITFSKAGTYVFTVKDANNPSLSASVTINMNIPRLDMYFGGMLKDGTWNNFDKDENILTYLHYSDVDVYYIVFNANVTSGGQWNQYREMDGSYKLYGSSDAKTEIYTGDASEFEYGTNVERGVNNQLFRSKESMGLVNGSPTKLTVRYFGGRHFKFDLDYDVCTLPDPVSATAEYDGSVFGDNNRSANLSCSNEGFAYYQWYCTDTDGREANVSISDDGLAQNCTATFNLPGTYHFKVKVGCGTISSVYRESGEMTVTTPYPEMRVVGPLFNGWTCKVTDDKIDGQMERNGLTWTKELVVNQSDQPFAIVQRYKNNGDKCGDVAGTEGWNNAYDANKLPSYQTSVTGVTQSGNDFTQSLGLSNGTHVKLTVTMNAWNNYSVTLERMYKVYVAVKSWGNDNNTAEDMQNWWDLIDYEGSFTKIGIINDTTDYRLANQGFTATARPYIADGEHRSVFLGWSTTPDSWDGSKFRDVTMITPINETYTKSSVDGDINLYAHFAFINTNVPTVNCDNVVVTASANSYADNINLADYGYTSSIGYKIGESGDVTKVATTGALITTWATGIGEDPIEGHQRPGWTPVTGTLTGLTAGTGYKCQHILTKSSTDYSAYIWQDFTTLTAPAVSASPNNTTAYEVITLTSTSGSVTWSKSDAAAYFVKDQKAVDSDTVDAVSVNFKAPAKNTDYTVTAEDSNGCTSNLNITISEPHEVCN